MPYGEAREDGGELDANKPAFPRGREAAGRPPGALHGPAAPTRPQSPPMAPGGAERLKVLLQLALYRLQVILHCLQVLLQFTSHTFAGTIGVILRLRPKEAQARLQHLHQLLCVFRLPPCLF
ncbi:hypothetical protein E2C01_096891 [Portunus trituberculatus]|uniref:Uncharacterized protein n=1 Tax=Portunus trituberculatus TaxID=210409 RepID=A0A5B7K820_PORTR|nr:hypothetical protein [Portunus trituberculatus]